MKVWAWIVAGVSVVLATCTSLLLFLAPWLKKRKMEQAVAENTEADATVTTAKQEARTTAQEEWREIQDKTLEEVRDEGKRSDLGRAVDALRGSSGDS